MVVEAQQVESRKNRIFLVWFGFYQDFCIQPRVFKGLGRECKDLVATVRPCSVESGREERRQGPWVETPKAHPSGDAFR